MIYTEVAVLKQGTNETLDNLEEGVIILDEDELEIKFHNKAASVLKSSIMSKSLSFSSAESKQKPNLTNLVEELSHKQFAQIDKSWLKN
jgi:nitrogen-specific signal transduction histidine kinase